MRKTAAQIDLTASRLPRPAGRRREVIRSPSARAVSIGASTGHKEASTALCARSERSKGSASSARYFAAPASASEKSSRACVGSVDQMTPSCVRVWSSIAPDPRACSAARLASGTMCATDGSLNSPRSICSLARAIGTKRQARRTSRRAMRHYDEKPRIALIDQQRL